MYGMVNKALEGLVKEKFGEEKWHEIKRKSEFDEDFFVSMKSYPDSITYDLVGIASEVLEAPAEVLLEEFGKYWILYTAEEGYKDILEIYGSDLPTFLSNLNRLHEQITMVMPDLTPPYFQCEKIDESNFKLTYKSERKGLKPMVVGLLYGLGARFDMTITVEEQEGTVMHDNHGEYIVSW